MTENKGPINGRTGQYVRRRRVNLRLDERIVRALTEQAAQERRTLSAQVETLLSHLVDDPGQE